MTSSMLICLEFHRLLIYKTKASGKLPSCKKYRQCVCVLLKGWQCTSLNMCSRFRGGIKETDLDFNYLLKLKACKHRIASLIHTRNLLVEKCIWINKNGIIGLFMISEMISRKYQRSWRIMDSVLYVPVVSGLACFTHPESVALRCTCDRRLVLCFHAGSISGLLHWAIYLITANKFCYLHGFKCLLIAWWWRVKVQVGHVWVLDNVPSFLFSKTG